jgi:hypothetical protein
MVMAHISQIEPSPIHFTFYAPLNDMKGIAQEIHEASLCIGFKSVGDLMHFEGPSCEIYDKDPHAALKSHARGIFVSGKTCISYSPEEFYGFTMTLKNGNHFHIGVCRYPYIVVVEPGISFRTSKHRVAQWSSFVRTVRIDPDCCVKDCRESHIQVLKLVKFLKDRGLLVEIKDPFEQWENTDSRVFNRKFQDLCFSH